MHKTESSLARPAVLGRSFPRLKKPSPILSMTWPAKLAANECESRDGIVSLEAEEARGERAGKTRHPKED